MMDRPQFKVRADAGWSGTLSLPRVLTLDPEGRLRMNPPEEIERLRYHPRERRDLLVRADAETTLAEIRGDSLELEVEMRAVDAAQYGVKVRVSPAGEEQTLVFYDAREKKLVLDTRTSSLTEGPKAVEAAPFDMGIQESLRLRIFIDKSVVEVFANEGRQAIARRLYPSRADSVGVSLFSRGGDAQVTRLRAWDMDASNPY